MNAQELFKKLLEETLGEARQFYDNYAHLHWDMQTNCPKGAKEGMIPLLTELAKDSFLAFTQPEIGEALSTLLSHEDELNLNQKIILKRLHFSYDRAKVLPPDFVECKEKITNEANRVWVEARQSNDFDLFAPHLKKVVEITREEAVLYGGQSGDGDSLYNALSQGYEPGMSIRRCKELMNSVQKWLVPFLIEIQESKIKLSDQKLYGSFSDERQMDLSKAILKTIGFDFNRGNLALSAHPFTLVVGQSDTRLTNHFKPDFLSAGLFAIAHEGGHGLFHQGVAALIELLRVNGMIISCGISESQSRLYENMVCRSGYFWQYFYRILQGLFPQYYDVSLNDFYRAINTVKPSPIRIYADEVSYNLHILLRFELELALLSGDLQVEDLPEAFNEKMKTYIGYIIKSFSEGVLQDMHWSMGYFGYFLTYTLGNLASAQLFAKFIEENPKWGEDFRSGEFGCLLDWLRQQVHQFGYVKELDKLMVEVTEDQLNPKYWFQYIEKKFRQLYELN